MIAPLGRARNMLAALGAELLLVSTSRAPTAVSQNSTDLGISESASMAVGIRSLPPLYFGETYQSAVVAAILDTPGALVVFAPAVPLRLNAISGPKCRLGLGACSLLAPRCRLGLDACCLLGPRRPLLCSRCHPGRCRCSKGRLGLGACCLLDPRRPPLLCSRCHPGRCRCRKGHPRPCRPPSRQKPQTGPKQKSQRRKIYSL